MTRFMVRWLALQALCLAFLPLSSFAQIDTLHLKRVEVTAVRLGNDVVGVSNQILQSVDAIPALGADVGSWLEMRSNIVLRGYGPGGSKGLSIRGAATGQSQVLINGIPFDNPGLASADLSLLPSSAFPQMSIYRGSASAYLGNAAIGGSLILETHNKARENLVSQSIFAGSFGSLASVTEAAYGGKRWTGRSNVYFRSAENNFTRPHPYLRDELIEQKNAQFYTRGFTQDLSFNTSKSAYHLFLWAGETDREIPPTASRLSAAAYQEDRNFRIQASAKNILGEYEIETKGALDAGKLNFFDPSSRLEDYSSYRSAFVQTRVGRRFGRLHLYAMAIYTHAQVETGNYAQIENRSSPALVAGGSIGLFNDRTELSWVLRNEFLNGNRLPFLPLVSVNHRLNEILNFKASAGRTYRLPGLNDLFWTPGGNPDLNAESGWFQEAGFALAGEKNGGLFSADLTVFHRLIDDNIVWQPSGAFWSVQNLKQVRAWGIEAFADVFHRVSNKLALKHSFSGSYTRSINEEGAESVAGNQLIYTPVWSLWLGEELRFSETLSALVSLRYVGERFTTADNQRSLPGFTTADLELHGKVGISSLEVRLIAGVRNFFDTEYRLQAAYYMPGRNYELGIQIQIPTTNKSKP